MNQKKLRIVLVVLIGLIVLSRLYSPAGLWDYLTYRPAPLRAFTAGASANELPGMRVVLDLAEPLPAGQNGLWCCCFNAAWQELRSVNGGPLALAGAEGLSGLLDRGPDPRGYLPAADLYTAAGRVRDGVVGRISRELPQRFPQMSPPDFSGLAPAAALAYAALDLALPFAHPYQEGKKALEFTGGDGQKRPVRYFGLGLREENDLGKLWKQPLVLFDTREDGRPNTPGEFALDLDQSSSPYQLIVARLGRPSSLGAGLAQLEEALAAALRAGKANEALEESNKILMPEMAWRIRHQAAELLGQEIGAGKLAGEPLAAAVTEIGFRLDRSGARLQAQSWMITQGRGSVYAFDGPFLLVLRLRTGGQPVLVLWVDNAELLTPWAEKE